MEQMNATRNTIRGLDQLAYNDAKIFAAHTGETLGEVVSEAIRRYIYDFETIEMVDGWLDDTLSVIEPNEVDKAKMRKIVLDKYNAI